MPKSRPGSERESSVEPAPLFPVFFYQQRQRVLATVLDTVLDVGRQREGEPDPAKRVDGTRSARIIVAPLNDVEVSRSHVQVEPADGGQVRITNLSRSLPVRLPPHSSLAPGDSTLATPPALVQFGVDRQGACRYAVRIDPPEEEELKLEGLPERTIPPGKQPAPLTLTRVDGTLEEASLLQWLETVLGVFQSAANKRDFPMLAARAAVKIVGLDAAAMLSCSSDGRWRVEALETLDPGQNDKVWAPSQTLLGRVRRERRTFFNIPTSGADTPRSLQDVSALVAAPILDGAGHVIGALYGDRRSGGKAGGAAGISAFDAKLVELLATGIAAGLARLKEEQAALAARVRFEQFFTPQLAGQLERDPQLLEGRDAEVTLLFADIRGFSRISERVGTERTMAWIQDTMGALSACVLEHDGVLVDYLGDELMAMWGAPVPQANHAELACLAAREMMDALTPINERWAEQLGATVKLGIGLNSGVARVGNTGSKQKFKYGPLGDVVNVASRVQGAMKYLGADCLITGSTLAALPPGAAVRRLARVRVVNIEHAIDLYEIVASPPADWERRRELYHAALEALEQEELERAAELAQQLAAEFPADTAAAALCRRVETSDRESISGDTSVWHLPGK